MLYIFLFFSSVSLFFYLFLFFSYKKFSEKNFSNKGEKINFGKKNTLTLIIAFRNERERILPLLSAVQCQDYPKEHFEIIFADDHSDDGTAELIENALKNSDIRYRIIKAAPNENGKKAAVSRAVSESQTDLILCTDADCVPCPAWVSEMNAYFEERKPDLLFSRVFILPEKTLFSRLQHIEFAALVATGAIFTAIGKPLYGNAASMLFKKSTFLSVGGYEDNAHIPSGDDEFLLKKIAQIGKVDFCFSENAVVATFGASNLQSFIAQRVRWASKWRAHGDLFHSSGAVLIFLMQFFRIFLAVSCFFSKNFDILMLNIFLILLIFVPEFVFLRQITTFAGGLKRFYFIFLSQILYPFYVLGIGLKALKGGYEWKGRYFSGGKSPEKQENLNNK